ncbi:MAG: SGNH/GDSL hydrolase family protein, partial [Acidobacteriota bacterium]|nr:SGNH/GDSL hydrolase family protein [Acidobacteriota bacterium]
MAERSTMRWLPVVALIVATAGVLDLTLESTDARFFSKLTALATLAAFTSYWALVWLQGEEHGRKTFLGLTVMALSTGLSLVAVEFAVRHAYRDVTTTGDNTSYFAQRWRHEHPPVLNALGFREREISERPPPGTYRIAVAGDSFTYGQGILEEDRLTNIVERRLNHSGPRYEVLNFGVPGAETVDHLDILETILTVAPDFVLLQWFVNDVEGRDKSGRPRPFPLLPARARVLTETLHEHSALHFLVNRQWIRLQRGLAWHPSYEAYMRRRFGNP